MLYRDELFASALPHLAFDTARLFRVDEHAPESQRAHALALVVP
jgi:hypothetical protein